MSDQTSVVPMNLSEAQRMFVAAAEQRGATDPARAVALTDLPRLPGRELDALVDAGLVREAADWRYYVYRGRAGDPAPLAVTDSLPPTPWRWNRLVRVLLFWILLLLIPILLIRLTSKG